jgi:hypothetical protein
VTQREASLRLKAEAFYGIVAFSLLFVTYRDDLFCRRPGGRAYLAVVATTAIIFTLWDAFGSAVGVAVGRASEAGIIRSWIGPGMATLIVGCGLSSVPMWIYSGYGHFRFENTWADMGCLFTEGYVYAFALVVAPVLALATLLREVLLVRVWLMYSGPPAGS